MPELWTENEQGELVTIIETYTQQEEAQFVVNEVEHLLEQGKIRLADCAVMYRTNAQSRALEEAFIRYGTPYKLVAGTRFYERREVKDIIAYLRFVYNQRDSVSLLRIINIPQRGIGERLGLRRCAGGGGFWHARRVFSWRLGLRRRFGGHGYFRRRGFRRGLRGGRHSGNGHETGREKP